MNWGASNPAVNHFLALAKMTFQEPRLASARVLEDSFLQRHIIPITLIVVSIGTILSVISSWRLSTPNPRLMESLLDAPIAFAIAQVFVLGLVVAGIVIIGRLFGGQGQFWPTFTLLIWLQTLMLAVQIGLFVLGLIVPGLATLFGLLATIYFMWLLVVFIAASHGFESLVMVFLVGFGSVFALSFAAAILLTMIGVNAETLNGL